jgi:Fe-S cluster assembly protein SufD
MPEANVVGAHDEVVFVVQPRERDVLPVDLARKQSDARQNNHNLLLSDNAEIDSKPQLEIWADDVQCSHGATVGQLDEDQVFYLRARGIAEPAARALLTRAFAMEVVDRVPVMVLQERLDTLLQDKLPRQEGKTC